MSIATEILSLRRDQSSSMTTLLALLEWQHTAQDRQIAETRRYAAEQAADLVLLNVAVHALESQDSAPTRGTRQAIRSLFRRRRGSDAPKLKQRIRTSFA